MDRAEKIIIELPDVVLETVDRERVIRGESRSAYIQRRVASLLSHDAEAVERYLRGYREQPETAEEIASAHNAGVAALAQEPWE